MMHEMDESEFQEQTGSSRARRHYYRLVAWNAVQLLIALAAAGVAVGTTHWINASPNGLLGINNAGLWSVCYTDVPEDETVDDLTRHLSGIVAENLFGADGTSATFNKQLEQELLEQDGPGVFKEELKDLLATNAPDVSRSDNSTAGDPEAAQKFVDELADGELTPDMIPQDVKDTASYQDALQRATVNVLVTSALKDFPVSSGCTNAVGVYKDDQPGKFFSFVPFPYGGSSYYVFQSLRGFVVGYGILGALACFIFFGTLAVSVGSCSYSNIVSGTIFAVLQVLCGLGGVICYFILTARIANSNSKQVLNVSYMFVDEPIPYDLHQYWGWSAWIFIGAAGWSLVMLPFLCCTFTAHAKSRSDDVEFGFESTEDNKDVEMMQANPAGDDAEP
ncbi:hypothetical protein HOP50_02g15430 [Chloropicon primus]|uniref:Transmembrane protein n=1 Tax=Chloropicon primus TaxID=1764295 RepID=A0A5B8MFQ8_9CHLO|nr:hypothetical protein A3770_02p15520 [Chloropicon primus]UPQ98243.1 hypothetical protein HOP50_02g15430 [Chloropicon primus]|mmetsp:Transcript_1055/g.3115  ORF Transcript_1055/g.3115 Transcript_1055/m.3115 type:complete len:392 (-) Transcript_1055:114-1289(-)|eukprot:QDZ19034.1 hypothetical protein A3770_02p15520 [Chloropicon primus]